ncbi:LOW QUALITY PROTEIN: hypothetical protein TorRG33x02_121450, partial [Trema orientale]
ENHHKVQTGGEAIQGQKTRPQCCQGYLTVGIGERTFLDNSRNQICSFSHSQRKQICVVRDQGPWSVDRSLLVIKEWSPQTPISEIKFETANF